MSRANRDKPPSRKPPYRAWKKLILVVAEGETETKYIDAFVRQCKAGTVKVAAFGKRGDPLKVVNEAKKRKQANLEESNANGADPNVRYDAVWVMFDFDEYLNVESAIQEARDAEISYAASNPCFELWLYIHFNSAPGPMTHTAMQTKFERFYKQKFGSDYHKTDLEFEHYSDHVESAKSVAKAMDRLAREVDDEHRNPTTSVWKLIDEISLVGKK